MFGIISFGLSLDFVRNVFYLASPAPPSLSPTCCVFPHPPLSFPYLASLHPECILSTPLSTALQCPLTVLSGQGTCQSWQLLESHPRLLMVPAQHMGEVGWRQVFSHLIRDNTHSPIVDTVLSCYVVISFIGYVLLRVPLLDWDIIWN